MERKPEQAPGPYWTPVSPTPTLALSSWLQCPYTPSLHCQFSGVGNKRCGAGLRSPTSCFPG